MALGEDFKKFLLRGNIIDLAVAVVIGGAFGRIVSAFVDDIVMPAVAPLLPGGNWREATVTPLNFKVGHLLGTLLDFIIVATVIFIVLVKLVEALNRKKAEAVPPPPITKGCPECLEVVPAAARRCKFCTSVLVAVAVLLLSMPAFAQPTPKFEAAAAPSDDGKPHVEWAAQVKGGLLLTSGNAQSTNGNLTLNVSRRAGDNRLAIDGMAAYGESNNRVIAPMPMSAADVTREEVPVTNMMLARGRYDRFLTARNALYLLGQVGRDKIAAKKLFGGAQAGYSRLLIANESHEVVSEIGYDFSYESYTAAGVDSVAIHSARLMVGEVWKVSDDTGVYANAEVLFNLNRETNALDAGVSTPPGVVPGQPLPMPIPPFIDDGVAPFKDTRVNAKTGITTKLWKDLSFGFGVTVRYDQNPALLAQSPAYRAFANTLDVIVDASLIVSLL